MGVSLLKLTSRVCRFLEEIFHNAERERETVRLKQVGDSGKQLRRVTCIRRVI